MEPIICNLGAVVPEDEFVRGVRKLCTRYGTLFVADEVATGFGRTGRPLACEHFDLEPDVLCMAKAITLRAHAPDMRLKRNRSSSSPPRSPTRGPSGEHGRRRPRLLLALSLSALQTACHSDFGGNYREAHVNPQSERITLTGRVHGGLPGQAFFQDDPVHVGHAIRQFGQDSHGHRSQLNLFFTDHDYRLTYREKCQELLSGPFGRIYGKSDFYYDRRYHGQPTAFQVEAYSKLLRVEFPEVSNSPPSTHGSIQAVSLVRVLRARPELLVVSATYSPQGDLYVLSVDGARGGDWISPNEIHGEPLIIGGRFYGSGLELKPWYGIPRTFAVEAYLADPQRSWGGTPSLPEELALVNIHYDRNAWVRQDMYQGRDRSVRYLRFPETAEDVALKGIDARRGFGAWTAATWE